jgi:antitoxin CptB
MKRRRDKTGRLTDKFIGHTNEEIDEPPLVGQLNRKDVYQSNHVHRHDDLPIVRSSRIRRPIRQPVEKEGNEQSGPSRANSRCDADTPALPGYKPAAAARVDDRIKPRHVGLRLATERPLMSGSTLSSSALDERRRRILFRAWRRGVREMDLIMGRFADAYLPTMNEDELAEFERLLDVPDPEALAWIVGGEHPPREFDTPLFARLCGSR